MKNLLYILLIVLTFNVNAQYSLPYSNDVVELDSICAGDDTRTGQLGQYVLQDNSTVITWAGDSTDFHPYIAVYNHTINVWSGKIKVGNNPYFDRHNYPKIMQNSDGRLFVFFGAHADNLQLATQDTLGNYTSWTQSEMDTPEASYPNPYVSKTTGRFYVFYAYTDNWEDAGDPDYIPHRPYVYVYSDDDGTTWSDTVMCIDRAVSQYVDADPQDCNEVYFSGLDVEIVDGEERVWFAWIWSGGPTHDDIHKNLNAAYFTPQDGLWHSPNNAYSGKTIKGVSVFDNPDYDFLVAEAQSATVNYPGYINHISIGNDGLPHINFAYKYNGTSWDSLQPPTLDLDDIRGSNSIIDEDGIRYHVRWGNNAYAYRSPDAVTWEQYAYFTGVPAATYTQICQIDNEANVEALSWIRQQNRITSDNSMFVGGENVSDTANRILIRAKNLTEIGDTIDFKVYTMVNLGGAYNFVDTCTNEVTIYSELGTILDNTVGAIDGVASFQIIMPDTIAIFKAYAETTDMIGDTIWFNNTDSVTFVVPTYGNGIYLDGRNEVRYDDQLNPNIDKYAVMVRLRDMIEVNAYSSLWGQGISNNWFMLDRSNSLGFRTADGDFRTFTGAVNSHLKNNYWHEVWFFCDSATSRAEIRDSVGTFIVGGTIDTICSSQVVEIGGGYSTVANNASTKIDKFKVWDLTDMEGSISGGEITVTAINALDPVHVENFYEGIGDIVYPDTGTILGTITEVFRDTTWLNVSFEADTLEVSLNSSNIVCNGVNDGSINVTATGGTPPYTYEWDDEITTEDRYSLSAGWYVVTVTDDDLNTVIDSALITQPTALVSSGIIVNETDGQNNGAIDLTVSGGVSPYSYIWSPDSEITQDINGKSAGAYSVTFTDDNECEGEDEFEITNISTNIKTSAFTIGGKYLLSKGKILTVK